MSIKSAAVIVLAVIMCMVFSGCDFFSGDTAELLSPPALTGDMYPIQKALNKSISGEYTLKYPSSGDHRSPVILNDINGDGIFEAFAFYSTTDGDTTTMHINVITGEKGNWKSVAEQKIVAGGVDRVSFSDLDGDGNLEILVGWEIYSSTEKQLAVYSLQKTGLAQRMQQKYSYFLCCDLNEDDLNEIILINSNQGDQSGKVAMYALNDTGIVEISSCKLDFTVKSINEPELSVLSSGKPAIYIDGIKGVGAITEVIFFEKGQLVNPLLNTDTFENTSTLRSFSIFSKDINKDDIIEIPIQIPIPSYDTSAGAEKLYYTDWCSYTGEVLTSKMLTITNIVDEYYFEIPEKWYNKITVFKDTEKRTRAFYSYNQDTGTAGQMLLRIQVYTQKEFSNKDNNFTDGMVLLKKNGYVYYAWIPKIEDPLAVSEKEVKERFRIIE